MHKGNDNFPLARFSLTNGNSCRVQGPLVCVALLLYTGDPSQHYLSFTLEHIRHQVHLLSIQRSNLKYNNITHYFT